MVAYSGKAQPYLDAIGAAVLASPVTRDWLLAGTPAEMTYACSTILADDQRNKRGPTKQPFWANYWCGLDKRCTCRIQDSRSLESDAVFFLRGSSGRTLAMHVEFKHAGEQFGFGQPEGYPLRAACFALTHAQRKSVLPHDDWVTVLFCGEETLSDPRISSFDRIVTHREAALSIPGYPVAAVHSGLRNGLHGSILQGR
jgi:hypothetical protein